MGLIVALWKTDVLKTSIIVLGTSKKIAILGLSSRQNKMAAARALCALLASPLWLLFVFLLDSFLAAEQQTVSMLDKYTSYGKDTTRAIQFPFPPSCPLHGLRFQLHGGRRTFLQGRLPFDAEGARPFQAITMSGDIHPNLQPWSQGLGISFYTHFAPPQPCAMLTKHFDLTQVCI